MSPKVREFISRLIPVLVIGGLFLYYQNRQDEEKRRRLDEQLQELSKHPPVFVPPPGFETPPPIPLPAISGATPAPATPAPATPMP